EARALLEASDGGFRIRTEVSVEVDAEIGSSAQGPLGAEHGRSLISSSGQGLSWIRHLFLLVRRCDGSSLATRRSTYARPRLPTRVRRTSEPVPATPPPQAHFGRLRETQIGPGGFRSAGADPQFAGPVSRRRAGPRHRPDGLPVTVRAGRDGERAESQLHRRG